MHPSNLTREASSTRGFVTLDPERQGVLVTQRRKTPAAGKMANVKGPFASQGLRQPDAASRFDHPDPIRHTAGD
jgi:hypothetical protein